MSTTGRGTDVNTVIRSLRIVASFALLGAVVMGILTGWMDHPPVDFRALGAGAGFVAGIAFKALHIV